ncbi:MAG TPA: hypothetical protein EYP17_04610 [Candidatus Latescibacteria bacterium]|nr:hypothetical protein [Candidatus Latescibacterota bacterium]
MSLFWVIALLGVAKAGEYAGDFLELGIGARPEALGGGTVGVSEEVGGVVWNPASLSGLRHTVVWAGYTPLSPLGYWDGYHYLGFAGPFGEAVLSASWVRLQVTGVPRFPELPGGRRERLQRAQDLALQGDGVPEGYFSASDDALYLTFLKENSFTLDLGWRFFELPLSLPVGVSVKFLRKSLGDAKGRGVGLDLGGMVQVELSHLVAHEALGELCLGLAIQDVGNTMVLWRSRHADRIRWRGCIGASYYQHFSFGRVLFLWGREVHCGGRSHWGVEWTKGKVALRVGYDGERPRAGVGLGWERFKVDYAIVPRDFGVLHRITGKFLP